MVGRYIGTHNGNAKMVFSETFLAPHLEHRLGVALEIADPLVHLRQGNRQTVGHASDLASRGTSATFTASRMRR